MKRDAIAHAEPMAESCKDFLQRMTGSRDSNALLADIEAGRRKPIFAPSAMGKLRRGKPPKYIYNGVPLSAALPAAGTRYNRIARNIRNGWSIERAVECEVRRHGPIDWDAARREVAK